MNSIAPRLMTKEEACAYVRLKEGAFDLWIQAGRIPGPLDGTKRWDRHAIDAALDKLSGLRAESLPGLDQSSDFDDWMSEG